MAGSSVTITFSKIEQPYAGKEGIVQVLIAWVGDDQNGSVPSTTIDANGVIGILGRSCVLAVTDPGTPAPTASYDIAINDEYGVDVFGGTLADRHTTNTEQAVPLWGGTTYGGRLCAGDWTFALTLNSVVDAEGSCILYFVV